MHQYHVYILSNESRTLYTGITSNLELRVSQHQHGGGSSFSSRYAVSKLVYCEVFRDVREAIAREKVLKGWTRAKKVALIESSNPGWVDLMATQEKW